MKGYGRFGNVTILSRLKEARLSNYIAGSYEQEQAVLKCREFVADGINKIRGGQGLFFQGPVGTGNLIWP